MITSIRTFSPLLLSMLLLVACGTPALEAPLDSPVREGTSQSMEMDQPLLDAPDEDSESISYTYTIVDTGQEACFNDTSQATCPGEGERFAGQDAAYTGNTPAFSDNGDGTVTDLNTGLMWIQDA